MSPILASMIGLIAGSGPVIKKKSRIEKKSNNRILHHMESVVLVQSSNSALVYFILDRISVNSNVFCV